MKAIISNTGPIIALAGIDRLDVLRHLFARVIVPGEVHQEISRGGKRFIGLEQYRRADWIEVLPLEKPLDPLLRTLLGGGESAVIAMAAEIGIDDVVIDELKARRIARDIYGLKVVGTARILVEAKKGGHLPGVGEALEQMRARGYWIHEKIVRAAMAQAGE